MGNRGGGTSKDRGRNLLPLREEKRLTSKNYGKLVSLSRRSYQSFLLHVLTQVSCLHLLYCAIVSSSEGNLGTLH